MRKSPIIIGILFLLAIPFFMRAQGFSFWYPTSNILVPVVSTWSISSGSGYKIGGSTSPACTIYSDGTSDCSFASGLSYADASSWFVDDSGDTMTGNLIVRANISGSSLDTSGGAVTVSNTGNTVFDINESNFVIRNGSAEFVVEGATGQIGLGAWPDDDVGLLLDTPARSITANQNYSRLDVESNGNITVTAGTTSPRITTAFFEEPSINEAGDGQVTQAATVWINNQPTEADRNFALYAVGNGSFTGSMSGEHLQVTGTGANPILFTNADGNVGIGTATSTATLEVVGTISGSALNVNNNATVHGTLSGATVNATKLSPRTIAAQITASGTALTVGSGKVMIPIGIDYDGMNLISADFCVGTPGITNSTEVQIRRIRSNAEVHMLSTAAAIETTETCTYTSATRGTINTSNDDVVIGDLLELDIPSISTGTAPTGLTINLRFSP